MIFTVRTQAPLMIYFEYAWRFGCVLLNVMDHQIPLKRRSHFSWRFISQVEGIGKALVAAFQGYHRVASLLINACMC